MSDPSMYWNFSGTAICFPSNGKGGQSVLRVNGASAGATTTYTETTAADSAGWVPTSPARGDYVVTAGGFWGILQSFAANTATVDYWRFPGVRGRQLPAAGTVCSIFQPNINAGCSVNGVRLLSMDLHTGAAGSISITDQKGTALITLVTSTTPQFKDWSNQDLYFPHPIGLLSVGANAGTLFFAS